MITSATHKKHYHKHQCTITMTTMIKLWFKVHQVEASIPTGLPEQLVEGKLSNLRSRTVKALEVRSSPTWWSRLSPWSSQTLHPMIRSQLGWNAEENRIGSSGSRTVRLGVQGGLLIIAMMWSHGDMVIKAKCCCLMSKSFISVVQVQGTPHPACYWRGDLHPQAHHLLHRHQHVNYPHHQHHNHHKNHYCI